MIFMKKGICGVSLKLQCASIGAIQCVSSLILIIVAAMRIVNPERHITNWEEVKDDSELRTASLNENDEIGLELMLAAVSTFIASILLLLGIKRASPFLIYPWIIITVVEIGGTFLVFTFKLLTEKSLLISLGKLFAVIFYYALIFYFLYSVTSYYVFLKKQKRNERNATLNLDLSLGYPSSEMTTITSSQPSLIEEESGNIEDGQGSSKAEDATGSTSSVAPTPKTGNDLVLYKDTNVDKRLD